MFQCQPPWEGLGQGAGEESSTNSRTSESGSGRAGRRVHRPQRHVSRPQDSVVAFCR